jgi:DNA anti-recombination protein RmuC
VFEQFTGQKLPALTGTMAEIQLTLTHLQTGFQTVVNNQQQLAQRLIALETKLSEIQTSANQHLVNLTQQFNSLRLTHTREKKEIAYNNPSENEDY